MTLVQSLFNVSEVELTYRNTVKPEDRLKVTTITGAYDVLMSVWNMNKIDLVEQFHILLLDRGGYCLGVSEISTGGVSACFVDPKIVFATALKAKASGLVMAHNHPSGNLKPSLLDEALTLKLTEGGKLLDIDVQDHLILTRHGYYSFAEHGLM